MARKNIIEVKLLGDNRNLKAALGESEGKLSGFATKVGKVALAAGTAIAAAGVAGAVKSVAAFTEFQGSMNEVFTLLPGITDEAMSEMSGQVKNFSKEFGVLPDEVVPALYQSLSAGVPAGNVFEFLETAQMAAKGGVTDLSTAVDGISSVVNAYGDDVVNGAQASDLMFTAVRLGKTTFEELSSSLSNVTPIASGLGVKFEDVSAGLAAMTAKGTPTAQATTQLRSLFVDLSKAGGKTAEVFEKTAGQSFQEFIAAGGDTAGALDIMKTAAEDSGVQIQDLFGSVEAGSAALSLSSDDTFANNIDEMGNSAGATEKAFDQMMTGLGPIFDKFKANLQVFMINVGEKLAPIVEKAMERAGEAFGKVSAFVSKNWPKVRKAIAAVIDYIRDKIIPAVTPTFDAFVAAGRSVVDFFTGNWDTIRTAITGAFQWMMDNKAVVVGAFVGVGVAIATLLVPPMIAAAVASVAAAAPLYLLVAAAAAVGAGLVYAYQNFEGFRTVVDAVAAFMIDVVWPKIQEFAKFIADAFMALVGFVQTHWGTISTVISTVIETVKTVIETTVGVIMTLWDTFGQTMIDYVTTAWDAIKLVIDGAINVVKGVIETVTSLIKGDWDGVWAGIKLTVSGVWDGIKGLVDLAVNSVKTTITTVTDAIKLAWETVWGSVETFVFDTWESIKTFVSDGIDDVIGFITGMPTSIASGVSGAFDSIYDGFKSVINKVIDAWNGLSLGPFTIPGFDTGIPGVPSFGGMTLGPYGPPNIPRLHTGGPVGSLNGPPRDIPIMAQQGEFMLSREMVAQIRDGNTAPAAAPAMSPEEFGHRAASAFAKTMQRENRAA